MHLSALAFQQNIAPVVQSAPPAANPTTAGTTVGSNPGPAPAAQQPSMLPSLLMMLVFVPILFLMFRRNSTEKAARAKLKKGDRIVSQSGLVGELMEMDDRFAKVKLGPGNTVTMLVSSLQPLDPTPAAKAGDKDLKDLKDAKAAADKK